MLFGQCPNRGGDLLKGASLSTLGNYWMVLKTMVLSYLPISATRSHREQPTDIQIGNTQNWILESCGFCVVEIHFGYSDVTVSCLAFYSLQSPKTRTMASPTCLASCGKLPSLGKIGHQKGSNTFFNLTIKNLSMKI